MQVNYFLILAACCLLLDILSSTCLKADMQYANKNVKNEYNRYRQFKG